MTKLKEVNRVIRGIAYLMLGWGILSIIMLVLDLRVNNMVVYDPSAIILFPDLLITGVLLVTYMGGAYVIGKVVLDWIMFSLDFITDLAFLNWSKIIRKIYQNRAMILPYLKWTLKLGWTSSLRASLGSEMAFWDVELNQKRPEGWTQPMFKDVYQALEILDQTFSEVSTTKAFCPRILELGPGPRSRLTEGYVKGMYHLVAVDPLADEYKEHLNGREFLVKGEGETMDEMFTPESFHMTYASNTLDHVKDPVKCFRNMFLLTKPGGLIIVQGNVNEGSRTGWSGLHSHDLYIYYDNSMSNKQLFARNRHGSLLCPTDSLNLTVISVRETLLDGNPWFSITHKKETPQ